MNIFFNLIKVINKNESYKYLSKLTKNKFTFKLILLLHKQQSSEANVLRCLLRPIIVRLFNLAKVMIYKFTNGPKRIKLNIFPCIEKFAF
jgi:hypothetical protein